MTGSDSDNRKGTRIKQSIAVALKIAGKETLVYVIDVSRGGIKLARPEMRLAVGSAVDVVVQVQGHRLVFSGKVSRDDGQEYIDRIKRSGNSYFIRIEDEGYARFMSGYYFV